MTIENILEGTNGLLINGDYNVQINEFVFDSRKDVKNNCFLPLQDQRDGHDFIENAVLNGLSATFIQKNHKNYKAIIDSIIKINKDICIIEVIDVQSAFEMLGNYMRLINLQTTVIGVTGSNGKTTTKEVLYNAFKDVSKCMKSEGSFNNNIGVPLTLTKLDKHDICIVEMGMNHQNEIDNLTSIALPNIGIITNIGSSHIGLLGSRENILSAKMEITNCLINEKLLILNGDDEYLNKVEYFNMCKVGVNDTNDLQAINVTTEDNFYKFDVIIDNVCETFKIENRGAYMINIALYAIKIATLLKLDLNKVREGLTLPLPDNNRMQKVMFDKTNTLIINDAYNASYESMTSGIKYVDEQKNYKKKILILSNMLELGEFSATEHAKVGQYISSLENITGVYSIGNEEIIESKYITDNITTNIDFKHFDNKLDAYNYITKLDLNDSIIYFKASRGNDSVNAYQPYLKSLITDLEQFINNLT